MRVALGVAEAGVEAVEHPVGHDVLQHLGLLVDLVPGVAEVGDEEGLQQPVPAHDGQGAGAALGGQLDPAVALVAQQARVGQLAHGLGGGGGRDAHALRQHREGDLGVGPLPGRVDGLEAVLRRRGGRGGASRSGARGEFATARGGAERRRRPGFGAPKTWLQWTGGGAAGAHRRRSGRATDVDRRRRRGAGPRAVLVAAGAVGRALEAGAASSSVSPGVRAGSRRRAVGPRPAAHRGIRRARCPAPAERPVRTSPRSAPRPATITGLDPRPDPRLAAHPPAAHPAPPGLRRGRPQQLGGAGRERRPRPPRGRARGVRRRAGGRGGARRGPRADPRAARLGRGDGRLRAQRRGRPAPGPAALAR